MKLALGGIVVALVALSTPGSMAGPIAPEGTQPGGLASGTLPADVSASCASCHAGSVDDAGRAYRPWDTWAGTMMANAARDPLFLAAVTIAEQDAPGAGEYCFRCHTPKGFVQGRAKGLGKLLTDDDKQGVECEACHRTVDPTLPLGGKPALDPRGPYIGNARLFWDSRDVRHGPYADADSPAHAAEASSFSSSSAFCGQCHELDSPLTMLRDKSGAPTTTPFPLDTTYSEWASSDFAKGATSKSCVECHMPKATGSSLTLATFSTAKPRSAPSTHAFAGGNAWGIDLIAAAYPDLVLDRSGALDVARAATMELLQRSAKLELTVTAIPMEGASVVSVSVRVTNLAGHKLPTGYADGRRAFVQLELVDASGAIEGSLGAWDSATDKIAGSVPVYEAVHAENRAGSLHEWHIAKNDTIVRDTRIPPSGMIPTARTAPVGADYGSSPLRNYDEQTLSIKTVSPLKKGAHSIRGRLMMQSTAKALVDELNTANVTDDRGKTLAALYASTGNAAPRTATSAMASLTVSPASASDAGATDASAVDAANAGAHAAATESGCGCRAAADPAAMAPAALGALAICAAVERRRRARAKRRGSDPEAAAE